MGDLKGTEDVEEVPKEEIINKGPRYGVRYTQALMMFLLLSIGYAMRVNLSVGIVAMTKNDTSPNPDVPTYDWDNKSVVLSSFFMGYIILQVGAGELGKKYGVKWFVVVAMLMNSVACILTPKMADVFGSYGVMACRIVQGLFQGFFFPSVHNILGKWAPQNERSTIGNIVFTGVAFGTIIATPATGLISQSWVGWPVAFYLFGGLGIAWSALWAIIGANNPREHKSITPEERNYIERSIGTIENENKHQTPWKAIFTSMPVWAIVVANFGQNWGYATLLTEIPNYLDKVCGMEMSKNTWLSAAPYAAYFILGLGFGPLADYWIVHKYFSAGTTRKIMNSIGVVVPGIALVVLGFIPEDQVALSVVLLIIAVGANSAVLCGFQVNHVDLSPKYAGTLMGLGNGSSNIFSIISPLVVQAVVTDESDKSLWRIVFIIAAGWYVVSDIFFLIYASGERQWWDNIENTSSDADTVVVENLSKGNNELVDGGGEMTTGENVREEVKRDIGKIMEKGPRLGCRHVQMILYFLLMCNTYCMRSALSVAIVAMNDNSTSENQDIPTYHWTDQSIVLSAFFWGYIIFQIPAAHFGKKYGIKWILVGSTTLDSIACILIPTMAHAFGSQGVMLCRFFQGVSQGFVLPLVNTLLGHWAPPSERSRIGTFSYAGSVFGNIVSLPITGVICSSWLGWPFCFYLWGAFGLSWVFLWMFFGFDRPRSHNSISKAEMAYIEHSLGQQRNQKIYKIPWKEIFKSVPVWALVVSNLGVNWGSSVFLTQTPTFLNKILKFDIKQNALLSAAPYLAMWIFSFIFSFICDISINRKWIGRGAARKIFNTIGSVCPAIGLLAVGFLNNQQKGLSVTMLIVVGGSTAGGFCGFQVNHLDLSPNHSGILMGLSNGLTSIFSVISPVIVHYIVTDQENPIQWRTIFIIAGVVYVITDIFYVIFASGKVQPWNDKFDEVKQPVPDKKNLSYTNSLFFVELADD
ncbi:uncharacterized protein LOC132700078 [Cylas formicarius]|uniref:uncharacterized protein LOC132700078 n=1 Tax=Cylas formicarius TaxID=197179 RepID=UPI002958C3A3|nr:uncharacterized protein LOC132700078 [Cylas formicarius]